MKKKIEVMICTLAMIGVAIFLTNSCKKEKKVALVDLSTSDITSITQTTASAGGNITSDGGAAVTARGVCWNTTVDPTIAGNKTADGSGTGSFTSSLTGLTAGTTYHVRAYGTNSLGTAYGADIFFSTNSVQVPTLTTTTATSIAQTTATSGGNISSDGGGTITARGVCWNTFTGPSATLTTKTIDAGTTGAFTSSITGLTAGTVYFVRAYATNSAGTGYGNEISFTSAAVVAPTLTTTAVTSITQTTASGGGNISSDGGGAITYCGICWSISTGPTVALATKTTQTGTTGAFTSSITGLTAGTVYYARAYATNSAGTAYGNEVSFTSSSATVPTLTTTAISSITQTTATSGGNISSDGGNSVTSRGVCWSTSTGPSVALSTKTSDATGPGSFTSAITGLNLNTTYYVRAYATNSVGTAYGNEISFTSSGATIPTLTTAVISLITQTTATSGGNISSDGGVSVTARGVCWSTTTGPTTSDSKTTNGTGTGSFVSSLTGLTANYTTYYVRAYATNSVGTAYGNEQVFATNAILGPTLTTTVATSITQTTASSGGNITDDGGAAVTARGVCWATTANPTTANNVTTSGSGSGVFTSTLTGLTANTSYYYRAYATNSAGTVYGNQSSFTTSVAVAPTLTTTSATNLTSTSATTGGNITSDGGASITASGVCWSTSAGPTIALTTKTTDGTGSGAFISSVTGLIPGTSYYLRAYATNSAGTSYGNQISFTTNASVPALTTAAITSITQNTATSGGSVYNDGGASITARGVCWDILSGPTVALTTKTNNGTGSGSFVSSVTGLTAGTLYYIRAYATNSAGTAYGTELTFTTSAAVVPTLYAASTSGVGMTSAYCWSALLTTGGATITDQGFCWSTSSNPTTTDNKISNQVGLGTMMSLLSGLTSNTYYVRAFAVNSAGTGYSTQVSFTTTSSLAVGQSYQGGIIAYIFQTGDPGYVVSETHGLIAPPIDQSTGATWGCYGTLVTGASGSVLGTGNQNTIDILAGCSDAATAARICSDLVLNGYSDWYLPSYTELNKLYLNRNTIGGFDISAKYWSSTQSDANNAWERYFNDGTTYNVYKFDLFNVRAVRTF
jgi:hypothetical protein